MNSTEKCLLLDRDGVCNQDRSHYVRTPEELILLPGVSVSLGRLHRAGYRILIITNQAGVGKGLITPATLDAIHHKLKRAAEEEGGRIDGIYCCMHTPDDHCACRKPAPGLILAAQKEWGFSPETTWMIGDAVRDVLAARAAGLCPALVRTGHGMHSIQHLPEIPAFDDLSAFTDFLLAKESPASALC
ncbi:MAG: HAD-IIIA family hydrolase [Magnetococcus sp. YQC-5]